MSLIAHFPLDSDGKDLTGNSPTSPLTGSGGTYVLGRIENCLNFGASNTAAISTGILNPFQYLTQPFSISCWIRIPNSYTWNTAGTVGIVSNGSSYNGSFGICRSTVNNTIVFYTRTNTTQLASCSMTIARDTWYHIVGINNPITATIEIYSNGVSISNASTSASTSDFDLTYFLLGGNSVLAGNAAGYYEGDLDDVRVYNHVLSLKEVKELYKCKVLHYKFNRLEEYTINIISSAFDTTFETYTDGPNLVGFSDQLGTGSACSIVSTTGYASQKSFCTVLGTGSSNRLYRAVAIDLGDYITFSCWCYSNVAGGYLHIEYNGGNYTWSFPGPNTSNVHTGKGWELLTISATAGATSATTCYYFLYPGVNTVGLNVYWDNMQIEKKDHATPYINGTRYDRITDNSGYGNDGTLIQTCPSWISDGKLGSGGLYFDKTKYVSLPAQSSYPVISISVWVKKIADGAWNGILGGFGSNWLHLQCATTGNLNVYLYGPGVGNGTMGVIPNSVWTHIALVYDGTTATSYINGIYTNSFNATGSITAYSDVRLGETYDATRFFYGSIDDVRIYRSALSQTDITDLYNSRAEIDNAGNLSIQQVQENNQFDYLLSRNNLVLNGDLRELSNRNFTGNSFTYDSGGYLRRNLGTQAGFFTDNFIEIDPTHTYAGELEYMTENLASTFYAGFACYDKNKAAIDCQNSWHFANTETTLSSQITNGDTIINITSSTNWNTTPASYMYFALWDPSLEYPTYTYTRLCSAYTTVGTNQITLSAPWAGGTFPTGTAVANAYTGGTYTYRYASGVTSNLFWTKYGGSTFTQSGWGLNEATGTFRYGTKYIKMLLLPNYNSVATSNQLMRNWKFYDLTDGHTQHDVLTTSANLLSTGTYQVDEINECPTRDLIAYYSFDNGLPLYPDNIAGTTYISNFSSGVDGWYTGGADTVSAANSILTYSHVSASTGAYKAIASISNKYVRMRVRVSSGTPLSAICRIDYRKQSDGTYSGSIANTITIDGTWNIINGVFNADAANPYIYMGAWASADTYSLEISFFYVGSGATSSPVMDVMGQAPNLTNTNGVYPLAGKVNNAAIFVSDQAQGLTTSNYTYFKRDEFSVSIWIKSAGLGAGMTFGGLVQITNTIRVLINSSGTILYKTYLHSAYGDLVSTGHSTLFDNTWHHVVCTYNNLGAKKIYIDGINRGTGTGLASWVSTTSVLIGNDSNSSTYYYNGLIDEVMIWSRPITQDEVTTLYNLRNPLTYIEDNRFLTTPQIIEG